jgi:hypothetical protein
LESLKLVYPKVGETERKELAIARKELEAKK